jgi:hypothetical protein
LSGAGLRPRRDSDRRSPATFTPALHFQPSTPNSRFVLYIRRTSLRHKDYGNAPARSRWRPMGRARSRKLAGEHLPSPPNRHGADRDPALARIQLGRAPQVPRKARLRPIHQLLAPLARNDINVISRFEVPRLSRRSQFGERTLCSTDDTAKRSGQRQALPGFRFSSHRPYALHFFPLSCTPCANLAAVLRRCGGRRGAGKQRTLNAPASRVRSLSLH